MGKGEKENEKGGGEADEDLVRALKRFWVVWRWEGNLLLLHMCFVVECYDSLWLTIGIWS